MSCNREKSVKMSGFVDDLKIGILDLVKEYSVASKKESLLEIVELEPKELRKELLSKCDKVELEDIMDWTKELLKDARIAHNLLSIPKGTGHRCIFEEKRRNCLYYESAKRKREEKSMSGGDYDDDNDDDDDDDDSSHEWVACDCRRIVICDACKPPDLDSDESDENVLDPEQQIERDYGLVFCLCQDAYCGDCIGEREYCNGDHGEYAPLLCSKCCSSDIDCFCDDCANSSEW